MPIGRVIFSQTVKDGVIHVEIGRDLAVPEGLWSVLEDSRRPGEPGRLALPPRIGGSRRSWIEVAFSATHASVVVKTHKNRLSQHPYASDLDAWSTARQHATTAKSWTFSLAEADTHYGRTQMRMMDWLAGQPKAVADDLRTALVMLGCAGAPLRIFDDRMAEATAARAAKAQAAAIKAMATRVRTATRGDNPQRWVEGDLVVTLYPVTFRSGSVHQVFYWVRPAGRPSDPAGCYLEIDTCGFGMGVRHKPRKYELRKVCLAAMDEVDGISAHAFMQLMRRQMAIEAARAIRKHESANKTPAMA